MKGIDGERGREILLGVVAVTSGLNNYRSDLTNHWADKLEATADQFKAKLMRHKRENLDQGKVMEAERQKITHGGQVEEKGAISTLSKMEIIS